LIEESLSRAYADAVAHPRAAPVTEFFDFQSQKTGEWQMRIARALLAVVSVLVVSSAAQALPAQPEPAGQASSISGQAPDRVAAPKLGPADLEAWLDGFFPSALQQGDIAGAAVMIVKDGSILLEKGYGYADLTKNVAMDPRQTVMGVGSVSKLFTWTAVMQLVEQGKLDLDHNVNDYLDFKIPDAFGQPITLRSLMTHTAGFEEMLKQYTRAGSAPRSLGAYLRAVPVPRRIYPPGTVPAYSNYGADLAGYIVERISGEPFSSYVENHILNPLGMRRSTFRRPPPPLLLNDLAKNYGLASSGEPLPSNANNPEPTDMPAGSFMSTADDMSRFMLAHLNDGRFENAQILSPETSQRMHATAFVPVPGAQGITLGFFRNDTNGHRIIAHDGDLSGFHTDLQLLLDDGIGFFTSVNSDGTGRLLGAAYAMRASLFSQFMDRYFPAPTPRSEPTLWSAKKHAKLVAGEYQMSRRPGGNLMDALFLLVRVPITDTGDGTIETPGLLNLHTGRTREWREVDPFVWREVGGTARLVMDVEHSKVRAWVTDDIGSSFVLLPAPYWYSATLNLPLLAFAAGVLVLQTLLWPAAASVRRHYGRPLTLQGRQGRAFQWTRIAAAIGSLYLLGWLILAIAISTGAMAFDVGVDPWIRVIQFLGLLTVPGLLVAGWSAWLTCTDRRPWWIKAWSAAIPLALLALLWFSFAFHVICISLSY
jgi:CubicO group peptidase (beta-lactamase class C family)